MPNKTPVADNLPAVTLMLPEASAPQL